MITWRFFKNLRKRINIRDLKIRGRERLRVRDLIESFIAYSQKIYTPEERFSRERHCTFDSPEKLARFLIKGG